MHLCAEMGELEGGWVAEKNKPQAGVKEIMVFESFFPRDRTGFIFTFGWRWQLGKELAS